MIKSKQSLISFFLLTVTHIYYSCTSVSTAQDQKKEGLLMFTTRLYKNNGDLVFNYPMKVWFRDSSAIELVVGVNKVIDTNNVLSVTYPLTYCRYIDLRRDSMYDFSSFTDTALLLRREGLPDSVMRSGGWAFYSKKLHVIKDSPVFVGDTTINGQSWKLGIFKYSGLNEFPNNKLIGFFRCAEPYSLFSLEHGYYERSGCRMDRFLDYYPGQSRPSGDREITRISSLLPDSVRKVFDRWEERISKNIN